MVPFLVEELRRLSQEEGFTDDEIASKFGCSRATVNRTRLKHGIPTANLDNRKDKKYSCSLCGKVITIARKERKKKYCNECKELL